MNYEKLDLEQKTLYDMYEKAWNTAYAFHDNNVGDCDGGVDEKHRQVNSIANAMFQELVRQNGLSVCNFEA